MKDFSVLLLIVLLICGGVLADHSYAEGNRIYQQEMLDIQEQITILNKEKQTLQGHIDELRPWEGGKTESASSAGGTNQIDTYSVLCLGSATEEVYKEIYPMLKDKNLRAVLVFKEGSLPGDNQHIGISATKVLLKSGWEYAIGTGQSISFDGNDEKYIQKTRDYLLSYIEKAEGTLGSRPSSVYFDENAYRQSLNSILKELGFRKIYYTGNYIRVEDDDLILVHSYPVSTLDKAGQNVGRERNVAIYTEMVEKENSKKEDVYNKSFYYQMVTTFLTSPDYRTVKMISPNEIKSELEQKEDIQKSSTLSEDEIREIEQCEARIEEIKHEIAQLYR